MGKSAIFEKAREANHEMVENRGRSWSPAQHLLYNATLGATAKGEASAPPPRDSTSPAIAQALTSERPRTRYYPGSGGGLPAWAGMRMRHMLPDALWDTLILGV